MLDEHERLIVTVPIFKDTGFLEKTSDALETATRPLAQDFLLVIVEDGSDSSITVDEVRAKYSNVLYLHHDERLGRGKALREAWKKVEGDVYLYLDADMATDLEKLDAYGNLVACQREYDLVTGSRYLSGSTNKRPWLRKNVSIAYNWLVRILFRTGVRDHQCGFKSFSRRLVERLATESKVDSWFWDTEVIVLAKKFGFGIHEIPICWVEKRGQRTPLKRLASDVLLHSSGLLRLLKRIYLS